MSNSSEESPKVRSATVGCSVGGKVQIVKFEYTQDFGFSMTRSYDIPDAWDELDVEEWQSAKALEMRDDLENIADKEVSKLMDQRDALNE